jgi:hypothetical protein
MGRKAAARITKWDRMKECFEAYSNKLNYVE